MALKLYDDVPHVKMEDDDRLKKIEDSAVQRWWLKKDQETLHEDIFMLAARIQGANNVRTHKNLMYAKIYNDYNDITGIQGIAALVGSSNRLTGANFAYSNRMNFNLIQSCVDTDVSLVGKNQAKPQFLTNGAKDWALKQRAINLTKYVDGVMYENNIYDKRSRVYRDSGIYGTGYLKWYIDWADKKVKAKWCFIENVLVDIVDGAEETPTTMYNVEYVPRDKVLLQYPDYYEQIMSVESGLSRQFYSLSVADVIRIVHAWHLPSQKGAEDGLYVVCVGNCTLKVEKYEHNFFPINVFRRYHEPVGFHGRGISQTIFGLHTKVNELMDSVALATRKVGVPLVFVEKGSKVEQDHLASNQIARLVYYTGQKPLFETPQSMNPEIYQWIDSLIQKAYDICGISMAQAAGRKDPEVKSGIAIEATQDIAAGRFEDIGIRWENFIVEDARRIIALSKQLFAKHPELSVKSPDTKRNIVEIKFADAVMNEDEAMIQCFPVSGLPSTPAGRLDMLNLWLTNGWITKEKFYELSRLPDLDDEINHYTSTIDLVQDYITKMKEDKEYHPPVPEMKLDTAWEMINLDIVLSLRQLPEGDDKEEILVLMRRFAADTNYLIKLSQPPAPPPQPGMPPPQPGQPMQMPGPGQPPTMPQ